MRTVAPTVTGLTMKETYAKIQTIVEIVLSTESNRVNNYANPLKSSKTSAGQQSNFRIRSEPVIK